MKLMQRGSRLSLKREAEYGLRPNRAKKRISLKKAIAVLVLKRSRLLYG